MLRMVREVDPPRPSTKLSTANALPNIAANRSIEPARLSKLGGVPRLLLAAQLESNVRLASDGPSSVNDPG
jgi:hypothetical protein